MVTNLLDNCLRHTPEGSKITVKVHNGEGNVVFIVVDKGSGIPAEHQDQMLRRFARMKKVGPRRTMDWD